MRHIEKGNQERCQEPYVSDRIDGSTSRDDQRMISCYRSINAQLDRIPRKSQHNCYPKFKAEFRLTNGD